MVTDISHAHLDLVRRKSCKEELRIYTVRNLEGIQTISKVVLVISLEILEDWNNGAAQGYLLLSRSAMQIK